MVAKGPANIAAPTPGMARKRTGPVIAGMALGTATFIAGNGYAEIIDTVRLTVNLCLIFPNIQGNPFPVRVTGGHEMVSNLAMAKQAVTGTLVCIVGEAGFLRRLGLTQWRYRNHTIIHIDDTVTVDLFGRHVRHAVLIGIPPAEPGSTHCPIRSIIPAGNQTSCEQDGHHESEFKSG